MKPSLAIFLTLSLLLTLAYSDVCTTPACNLAAKVILAQLDRSVNPCNDFGKFVCGGLINETDNQGIAWLTGLDKEVDRVVKGLLEKPITKSDASYVKQAKTFYASCLNYDRINKIGHTPFLNKIKNEFGGWPLTTLGWDPKTFDLTDIMTKLIMYKEGSLMQLWVFPDDKNSKRRIFWLDQPLFAMPEEKIEEYRKLIISVGKVFGFANPSTAENEVNDIVEFEKKLANISVPGEERHDFDKLYNLMTLKQLNKKYNIINWKRMVNKIMTTPGIDINDINDDDIVLNQSPSYFEKLNKLVDKTKPRTIANYLIWRIINTMSYTQGDGIQNAYKQYEKAKDNDKKHDSRDLICAKKTQLAMILAVGKLYVKQKLDTKSQNTIRKMYEDMKGIFKQMLDNVDWLNDQTKKAMKEKVDYIITKIGYPDVLDDEKEMVKMHQNFNFKIDNCMENAFIQSIENFKREAKTLREPVDRNKHIFNPSHDGTIYEMNYNMLMFPAGFLQHPLYDKNCPMSLNYGGIGWFIGNEITTALNDFGIQFDKTGNLVKWLSDSAVEKLKSRAQCLKSNDTKTRADAGGLEQSFKAYQNWVKIQRKGKEEQRLRGLEEFSSNQLFFINYGQLWCSKEGVHAELWEGQKLTRTFENYVSVQNSKDFSDVFQCREGDKMNPAKKCSMW